MGRVVVVGAINIDSTIRCAALPSPGETVVGRSRSRGFGGKGANQAAASARLGVATWMVGVVGSDRAGDDSLSDLKVRGVHTEHVTRSDGVATGGATVLVDDTGENAIIVVAGANDHLAGSHVTAALTHLGLDSSDVIVASGEVAEHCAIAAARSSGKTGARLIYSLAPARPPSAWVSAYRPIVVLNEGEAMRVTGMNELDPAMACLARSADAVVVTRGPKGSLLRQGIELVDVPAPRQQVVDSTGAGDAFCGAFAAELACGLPLDAALRTATIAGSFAVTAHGARGALARRSDLERDTGTEP